MIKTKSLTRILLDKKIIPIIKEYVNGKVLDVGADDSPYKQFMSFKKHFILDIKDKPNVDYVQDIHHTTFPNNHFDTIVATEVLEHLHNPRQAVKEIHRILKPNSFFIGSVPFIHQVHGAPYDFFRFTSYGLNEVFDCFDTISVSPYGSLCMTLWDLLGVRLGDGGIPFRLLNGLVSYFDVEDSVTPLGYIIIAKKGVKK